MGEYNLCPLDIDYILVDGRPIIRMFGRTDDGKSVVAFDRTFEPYFYIESENPEKSAEKLREREPDSYSIEKVELTEKVLLGEKTEMIRLVIKKPGDVPKARKDVKNVEGVLEVYEAHVLFNKRYMFDKGLKPMTMVKVEGNETEEEELVGDIKADKFIEIEGDPVNTKKPLPELKVMAFDIEVYNPEGSPRPKKDEIIMLSYKIGNTEKVISTKAVEGFEDKITKVNSEIDIIKKFEEIVETEDVDLLVGYNTDKFDLPYIRDRAKQHDHTVLLGRTDDKIKFKRKGMFSAAQIKGRVHIDLFHYVSYILRGALGSVSKRSLSNVAHVFLDKGAEKGEIDWREIPDHWDSGGEKLRTFFEYSLNDAVITKQLSDRFTPKIYEIAKLVKVPLFDANRTSYGQLVENYLIWNAHEMDEIVPNRPKEDERESRYKRGSIAGAYVHEPEKGMHEDIALLDFRSLYPTIIISHNIDPGTIDCDCCRASAERVGDTGHWFCEKRDGLIPTVLEDILNKRIEIKEKMKELDENSQEYSEMDNEQYALKILANSAYGYLAYRNARWYTREGAECVTYLGRMYIKKIMEIAEDKGLNVIYGDSITGDRFVTVKNANNDILIKNIEELFLENKSNVVSTNGKERTKLKGYSALTIDPETKKPKWSKINEIIRHKTNKKILRVNQKYGETIATEDHSLMTEVNGRLKEIKPKTLGKKPLYRVNKIPEVPEKKELDMYELLKDYTKVSEYKGREKISKIKTDGDWVWFSWTNRKNPVKLKRIIKIESKEFEALCRLLGAYIAEGSASTIETSKNKFGASISEGNKDWLKNLQKDYHVLFDSAKTSIIRSSKGKRRVQTKNKKIEYKDKTFKLQMMNELSAIFFKKLCGQLSSGKKLPNFIFRVPKKYKKLLLEKLIEGDGTRSFSDRYSDEYVKNNFRLTTKSLALISGLSLLLNQLDQKYTIRYRADKEVYRITTCSKYNPRLKTKIGKEGYSRYVYDLNVKDSHTFVDSCGQILLHNTDSLFVTTEEGSVEDRLPGFMESVKPALPGVMELELEGIFKRGIFVSKKRYALIDDTDTMKIKGLEFVRKDWSPLAKETQKKVLKALLKDGSAEKAFEIVRDVIKRIKEGDVEKKDLAVYTELTRPLKKYKVTAPHIAVGEKMKRRGKKVTTGTTVGYIIMRTGGENISDRARSVEKADISKYDKNYYIKKQIIPAVSRVMGALGYGEDELLGKKQETLEEYFNG